MNIEKENNIYIANISGKDNGMLLTFRESASHAIYSAARRSEQAVLGTPQGYNKLVANHEDRNEHRKKAQVLYV